MNAQKVQLDAIPLPDAPTDQAGKTNQTSSLLQEVLQIPVQMGTYL